MKAAALAVTLTAALAACAPAPPPVAGNSQLCDTIGALGAVIMAGRQTGRSREQTLQSVGDSDNRVVARLARSMVDAAYRAPIRGSRAGKAEAVKTFTQFTAEACRRAETRAATGAGRGAEDGSRPPASSPPADQLQEL